METHPVGLRTDVLSLFSLSLSLSLSLSPSLSFPLSVCLHLPLFLFLFPSLCLSLYLPLSLWNHGLDLAWLSLRTCWTLGLLPSPWTSNSSPLLSPHTHTQTYTLTLTDLHTH